MTTASASSEHGDRFRNTKNTIASLSNKNQEMLDQINKLQCSQLQALTAINSQLDTIPQHANERNIDSLVNSLKSRRRLSFQQQSTLPLRPEVSGDGKNLDDVMEVEDVNDSRTIIIDDSFLSSKRSSKISNRNTKDPSSSNSAGELDWKYLSAEPNSDPENTNEISNNLEDIDDDDLSVRRRRFKNPPMLTINTNANPSHRLITPESSDSEFDISTAHMPLAPTLGEGRNPLRATRHSSTEIYKSDRRGSRPSSMIFSSMGEVIEEERESLSDIAEHKVLDERSSEDGVRVRSKQTLLINGRRRARKYVDEYDVEKSNKMNLRTQMDESYPVADAQDDNSSVISSESLLEEIGVLRSRIQKLESEHASLEDDPMSERKQRRKKNVSDSFTSPSAVSPSSSQGGASSSNASTQRPSSTAQHNKHLQNAFDFFEKAFTTSDQYSNDASPPPSHSMAMVVSSALLLNTKLRGIVAQVDDNKPLENSVKALLKTSDEQIRSLTECLLALSSFAPKKPSKRISSERDLFGGRGHAHHPSDPTLLQMPTPANSTRSVSPIQKISTAPEINIHESQNFVDHMDSSTHRVLPTDQQSYYYNQPPRPRYNRISRPPSPVLLPENINDPQYSQFPSSRVLEYRSRRISGSAYGGSFSGIQQNTSPSPPPPSVPNYDTSNPNVRTYHDRGELSRLQKYGNQSFNNTASPSIYQRTTSRPSSYIRTEEPIYPTNHARNTSVSSLHRSSSGRSYALRGVNDEFVNNPVSAPRQQSRTYEYTRRYPSDAIQTPIERRQTPMSEMERRYGRRGVNSLELEGYDVQNGYGEHISERDYIPREENPGLRRNDSNGSTNDVYRQRLVPPLEDQEVQNNEEGSSEESRSIEGRDEDLQNNVGQDPNQANGTSNNDIENGGYI